MRRREGLVEARGEGKVAEVVGRRLQLPAGRGAQLGGGHDPLIVHQYVQWSAMKAATHLGDRSRLPHGRAARLLRPSGTSCVSEKNIAQGAATCGVSVDGVTGRYFEDCQEAGPHTPGVRRGVAARAVDPDNARERWDLSVRLTARER